LRVLRVRRAWIILIFLLVVSSVGITTYFTPRQYASFATIEVQADMIPFHMVENQTDPRMFDDQKFSQTQFQIIQRKGVLYRVIDRLNLREKWAVEGKTLPKEAAYKKLRDRLSLEAIRNTNLIQIDAYSPDPQEAALLANTVAQVYMEQRIAEQEGIFAEGLDRLRDEVKQRDESVNRAYVEASTLRTKQNIIDPNPESLENNGRFGVEDSSVITNQEKVNEAKSQIAALSSRVEQLQRLSPEDLMRSAGELNLNDPIIQGKLSSYQSTLVEQAKLLNSGLGRNHPDVKALQAQIEMIGGQLQQQIDSLRKSFATQLAIAQNSLKAMEANLESSQADQQASKTASAQYLDAKYRYIQERKLLDLAKTRLSTESMEHRLPQSAAFIRDPAEPALFPSKPRVKANMLLGIAAGIILGISFAFFLEYLDTSVKTVDDVTKTLKTPLLAVIPRGTKLLPPADKDSSEAEAYRILKTNIDLGRKKSGAISLGVTSGGISEGKSTIVCGLATSWAACGRRVLIIDGDMRRPSQHVLFEKDNSLGLSHYLVGGATLDDVILPTAVSNMYLISAGPAPKGAGSLLDSGAMDYLIRAAKKQFDVILIDSPPLLGMSDALILASLVDCSILVVEHRRFPQAMLVRVKKTIEDINSSLLGVVLNKVDVRDDENYQYTTSYNTYYISRGT
jgi:capsular exopolysaccharide synthesis family protein